MSKTETQIEAELSAQIPRSAVRERDGGGGRTLSYLSGHYVIGRLNEVFGPLGWSKEILEIKEVVNKTKRGEFPAYIAKVRLTVKGANGVVVKESYGYGADKSEQNAHELAIKEAITDGLKVSAKDLGNSMGLALYDPTQEGVSDDDTTEAMVPGESKQAESPKAAANDTPVETKASSEPSQAKLEEAIRSYVRIADKQKKMTTEQFKDYLAKEHNVSKLAEMTTEQLKATLEYLKEVTK